MEDCDPRAVETASMAEPGDVFQYNDSIHIAVQFYVQLIRRNI